MTDLLKRISSVERCADAIAKDLSGYAAQAAVQRLVSNWRDAEGDSRGDVNAMFQLASMQGDLDEVIGHLQTLKLALDARVTPEMADNKARVALGLEIVECSQAPIRQGPPAASPEVVIGAHYELPDGLIARTVGWNGERQEVTFYLDDAQGGRTVSLPEFSSWKIRRDLTDFPNASDPRLPYVFDLFWDIKYLSDLKRELPGHPEHKDITAQMAEHNIVLP